MALSSYYSNYGQLDFSSSIFKEQNPFEYSTPTQIQPNHFTNYDNLFFDPVDTYLNDPTDSFLTQEIYTQVAENPLFDESFVTLEDHELMSNRFLKRQKCYYEDDKCSYSNNNNNALMGNYYYMKTPSLQCYDLKQPQVVVPPPPSIFTPPQYFQESSFTSLTNTNTSDGCNSKERESSVTAQSIAARTRRKKISDKTIELSKLIPGGRNKMNSTAEMLHAAFKYVKFMQAQVGILQSMSSLQESEAEEGIGQNNLEELVTSGKIQDKLSSMEKCLVPIDFVKELAKSGSFPSVSDTSLNQLLVLD